ncbi:peptidoglycan bridge formation glycyltransferase FemA/FemB family protein [Priestia endophytica]
MRGISDIYFDDNYGKLYERVENGEAAIFDFSGRYGRIKNQFIKREIPISIIKSEQYYDIVTPYGYGGPLIIDCLPSKKKELLKEYHNAFMQYCIQNNIVSEFVRFHPIEENAHDFTSIYDISCLRKTLGTNLRDYEEPTLTEFSKSCRKNIRKALNKGVTFEIIENPCDIGEFKDIYYSTMRRNKATEYYYFDEQYFSDAIKYFQENIIIVKAIYNNQTIAQGFYFVYKDMIHTHLSGTLTEYLYLSPAYVLRYAVTLWGKEKGYDIIHHGGGRSNSDEDSLFKFKKSFAKNTSFDFYVGKKIWNEEIYDLLCKRANIEKGIDFFPAYRFKKDE